MAALTAISAVATFLVLSQLHSTHAAPTRDLPRETAAVKTEASPVHTPKANAVSGTRIAADPAPAEPTAPAVKTDPPEASPRLRSKGSLALLAEDDSSLEQMIRDPKMVPQLIHDGRLFSASPGTKVEILERQGRMVHVRLLEGETADRSGWVSRSAISNLPRR
ncbi:MAG: hypothetical protein ACLQVN_18715 [Bryobacteraceae bacterium]